MNRRQPTWMRKALAACPDRIEHPGTCQPEPAVKRKELKMRQLNRVLSLAAAGPVVAVLISSCAPAPHNGEQQPDSAVHREPDGAMLLSSRLASPDMVPRAQGQQPRKGADGAGDCR